MCVFASCAQRRHRTVRSEGSGGRRIDRPPRAQEGIYKYAADDGSTFQFTTFLLVVECALNVAVGAAGAFAAGPTAGLPQSMFALTGFTQIAAKFFTNAAMATGVSFPTQVLRNSCVPVLAWYRALLQHTPPASVTSTSTPSAQSMHNRLSRHACQARPGATPR